MTLSLLHGLEVAPLCKVSGCVALMASGRSYLCVLATLSIRVCLADMTFPGSMSQVCFWHTQSLTLLPGPSHLLRVAWLEPVFCRRALICQWHSFQ